MDQVRKTAAGFLAVWAAWSLLDQWFLPSQHPLAEVVALLVAAAIAVPWPSFVRRLHACVCGRCSSTWQRTMEGL